MTIKGWRERAGLPESYEVYGPSPVERAMLEEIAELRAALELLRRSVQAGIICNHSIKPFDIVYSVDYNSFTR